MTDLERLFGSCRPEIEQKELRADAMNSGHFVVIEGIDGAGKSTTISAVAARFRQLNVPHVLVNALSPSNNDPILTEMVDSAGRIVFRSGEHFSRPTPKGVALADASRYALLTEGSVQPAMELGQIVLSDSWCYKRMLKNVLSVVATNSRFELGQEVRWISSLFRPALCETHGFFLDVEPSEALSRKRGNISPWEHGSRSASCLDSDRLDSAFRDYQTSIRSLLNLIAQWRRWETIRIEASPEEKASLIVDSILSSISDMAHKC